MDNHTISSRARKLVINFLPAVAILVMLGGARIVGASDGGSAAAAPTITPQAQGTCGATGSAQPSNTELPWRSGHPH